MSRHRKSDAGATNSGQDRIRAFMMSSAEFEKFRGRHETAPKNKRSPEGDCPSPTQKEPVREASAGSCLKEGLTSIVE